MHKRKWEVDSTGTRQLPPKMTYTYIHMQARESTRRHAQACAGSASQDCAQPKRDLAQPDLEEHATWPPLQAMQLSQAGSPARQK